LIILDVSKEIYPKKGDKILENKITIIKMILEILDTIDEGIKYITLKENKGDINLILLEDIKNALLSVDGSLDPIKEELPFNEIELYVQDLITAIEKIFNGANIDTDMKIVEEKYDLLKSDIRRCLEPYILC